MSGLLDPANIPELIQSVRKAVEDAIPPEEPDILKSDEILLRFLKSRDWDLLATIRMLRKSLAWRAEYRPQTVTCQLCRSHPGCHSLRQVGFDEAGRPVIYACFYQSVPQRSMATGVISHLIYVIENAVRTMKPGVSQWVLVMDCSGMTSSGCNPRVSYECAQLMSNHYPERLGLAICINPGPVFKVAWQAIKPFLSATTAAKVCLTKNLQQMKSCLNRYFSQSMVAWFLIEYELNRQKPKSLRYRQFWMSKPTLVKGHDPRGEKEYVDGWLRVNHPSGHLQHPNIVDHLTGRLSSVQGMTINGGVGGEVDDASLSDEGEDEMIDNGDDEATAQRLLEALPKEFRIPTDAAKLS